MNYERKGTIWGLGIIMIILGAIAPFIINGMYFKGEGLKEANTYFSPSDLLGYVGSLFILCATAILGYVSFRINQRLIRLEEGKYQPRIDVILLTEQQYEMHKKNCSRPIRFETIQSNTDAEWQTQLIGEYNGYNFLATNITDNYIHRIELKNIKVTEIDENGKVVKPLVNNVPGKFINDTNTYLKQNEERYMEINGEAFNFTSFHYRKYEMTFVLFANNIVTKEKISFEVQNVKDFYFQRNKKIIVENLNATK